MNERLDKIYRRNVAAFVLNELGEILLCRRCDAFKSWQLPQGGIDEGETPEAALLRELTEEIGTSDVEILAELEHPIRYEWPESLYHRGFHGQDQSYFLVRLRPGAAIDLNLFETPEFDEYAWVRAADFISRIEGFKKEAYAAALDHFTKLHPTLFSR